MQVAGTARSDCNPYRPAGTRQTGRPLTQPASAAGQATNVVRAQSFTQRLQAAPELPVAGQEALSPRQAASQASGSTN